MKILPGWWILSSLWLTLLSTISECDLIPGIILGEIQQQGTTQQNNSSKIFKHLFILRDSVWYWLLLICACSSFTASFYLLRQKCKVINESITLMTDERECWIIRTIAKIFFVPIDIFLWYYGYYYLSNAINISVENRAKVWEWEKDAKMKRNTKINYF